VVTESGVRGVRECLARAPIARPGHRGEVTEMKLTVRKIENVRLTGLMPIGDS
jgi:hypothetical protein